MHHANCADAFFVVVPWSEKEKTKMSKPRADGAASECRGLEKWAGTLTDRERFMRQMHYEPVDRCFNCEFGYWDENFSQWSLFRENGITNNQEADVFFGFDRMKSIGALRMSPPFPVEVVEDRGETQIIRNNDGLLAEVPKDQHGTIPHFIGSSIQTPDDWLRCKEERFRRDDPARCVDIATLQRRHPQDRDYPLGVGCGSMIGKIRDMLTFEGLAYAVYDYPEMVEDMVETHCLLIEDFLDQVLPHFDFDYACGWEDICFNSGPLVSPDYFRQVIAPRYQRIHAKLKEAGIDVWFTDTDGDVRPLIPIFLESGLNCLFPFEVGCSGHPGDVLDEYGKDLLMMGGVDKKALIAGPGEIRRYMKSLVPYVERGGFIPHVDHRCPPDVTPENYLYYLELKKQMFGV